jgi:FkbM family methyltransferase
MRFRQRSFSEADLIWHHFAAKPRKGVMIDAGAHLGGTLLPYLEMKWRVLAFEPDAANRNRLQQSVRHPGLQVFDLALSDVEKAAAPFYASDESDGISSLSAFRPSHREVHRVTVSTLKKVLAEHPVERVDFLKVDTEGHDLFVLRGFPWASHAPEVVLCEFEDRKTLPLGYDFRALGDLLVQRKYEVFLSEWTPIERYGASHSWRSIRRYPCSPDDPNAWGNFVAIREGCDLDAMGAYLRRFTAQAGIADRA